jgi:PAS domain S-box-containing protein
MSLTDTERTVLHVEGAETPGTPRIAAAGEVLTAGSAGDALATVADGAVDCVVVDASAADVARRVRERHPEMPLVLRTDAGPVTVAPRQDHGRNGDGPESTLERSVEAAIAGHGEPTAVLESVADGVYALDTDLRLVAVNEALAELAGHDRAALLGEHVSTVLDEATVDAVRERLSALQRGDGDGDCRTEVDLRRADGERVPVEVGFSPVESGGTVVGVAGVVRDVTARRERRRELELWEAMVDAVADGLYALDADRTVLAASEGFARIAGRDVESLLGEHISVCIEPSTIDENVEERRAVVAGEQAYGDGEFDVVRPDGERVPVENRYTGLPTEQGLRGTAGVVRDITDRRERERELELWRAMVDAVADGLYALDADRTVVAANEAFAEMVGRDVESLLGEHVSVCIDESVLRATDAERQAILDGELSHGRHEFDLAGPDGDRTPVEIRYAALPESEGLCGTTGVVRDVTDRRRRERALAELHDWTRRMIRTEDAAEVLEAAAGAAGTLFEEDGAGVYALDDDGGLVLVDGPDAGPDATDRADGSGPPRVLTDGPVWEAFVSGTARTAAEPAESATSTGPDGPEGSKGSPPLGAGLVHPLGTHGVVVVGWGREEPVPRDTAELVAVLAANVETALDRAAVETTLRDRERRLTARNEELARLDRTNAVIRGVHRALISAGSREAGRVAVADWLAEADPYALAWFARVTGSGDEVGVEPVVGGGDAGREYVDALRDRLDGSPLEALVAEAAATHEVRTRSDVLEASDWIPFRSDALAHGYRSVAAIPVTVSGRVDGVLVVHGADAATFPPADAEVLSELGGLIGRTLRTVDRAGVGSPDHRLVVELELPGRQLVFNRLSAEIDAPVVLEGSLPVHDGSVMSFVSAPVAAERLVEGLRSRDAVSGAAVVADEADGALVELRKPNCQLTTLVHDAGGRLRSVTATGDGSTVTLEFPLDVDVRSVVEAVEAHYPGTALRARHERASADVPRTVRASLRERCTDRQYEALTGAYYSGYYDWPRLTTVADLAERAGVSSPTFQYHLRTAERKLLDVVLG